MMLPIYLVFVNVACFCVFAADKAAARAGRRRVPERQLLALALVGGTGGALLASTLLRHKTRKQPFRGRLLGIAVLQGVAILVLLVLQS